MLAVAVTGAGAIAILVIPLPLGGQEQGPMWSQWNYPTNGAVVSNTIILSASFASMVAPIVRVEWYRDDILFYTWTNNFSPPGGLRTLP